jgi:hypothetical protein
MKTPLLVSPSVAKYLLGSEVTSADAGNGPCQTSPNAVREISFQCKKGLTENIMLSADNMLSAVNMLSVDNLLSDNMLSDNMLSDNMLSDFFLENYLIIIIICVQDCNGDQLVTCEDYVMIHKNGGWNCGTSLQGSDFWTIFQKCKDVVISKGFNI